MEEFLLNSKIFIASMFSNHNFLLKFKTFSKNAYVLTWKMSTMKYLLRLMFSNNKKLLLLKILYSHFSTKEKNKI